MNKYKIKANPNSQEFYKISEKILENEGYCCCAIQKTPDTKCPCVNFRQQKSCGFCECGRFYKTIESEIITLCGSTRFKEDFERIQKKLTLQGKVVITVGVFGHSGDSEGLDESTKQILDDIHKKKIEISDAIFVINKNGYIGESTRSEINWAIRLGKKIYSLEPFNVEDI